MQSAQYARVTALLLTDWDTVLRLSLTAHGSVLRPGLDCCAPKAHCGPKCLRICFPGCKALLQSERACDGSVCKGLCFLFARHALYRIKVQCVKSLMRWGLCREAHQVVACVCCTRDACLVSSCCMAQEFLSFHQSGPLPR